MAFQPGGGNFPRPAPDFSFGAGGWFLIILVGFGILGGIRLLVAVSRKGITCRVRIVAVPPGEAPEAVRRAWVGLELPARSAASDGPQPVFGVLSQKAAGQVRGYAVGGAAAVRLLAEADPNAADWWRQNAPHVLTREYQLVFPEEVCERVV
jgi:hypothetical protein